MAVFADAEEVYRYLAGIFRRGLENEDLANRLAGSGGVVLRIHYTDPDAVVTVDMPKKVIETGADSGVTPNVELFMSADTGNRFWLGGKVNLTMAMAKGTVRAKGPVTKLIKLIPQAKNLFFQNIGQSLRPTSVTTCSMCDVSPVRDRARASGRRGPWATCPEIIHDSSRYRRARSG